jgi:hypothetical protein
MFFFSQLIIRRRCQLNISSLRFAGEKQAESDGEGRADQDHVIGGEESLVLCWCCLSLRDFVEEGLNFACGGEGEKELAAALADEGPDVGDIARCEDGVARVEGEALVADLGDELSFENVEPLILMEMEVARRAAFLAHGVFGGEEVAVAVLSEDLVGDGAVPDAARLAGAVLMGEDGMNERRGWCGLSGRRRYRCGGLAEGSRGDGSGGEREE